MKDKLIATGIHLLISAIVALSVLALLVFYWFPGELFGLGAAQGIKIILIVDIVLGPVCTFIVYKKGKSTLKFDLSVIVLIQIGALIYGLIMVYSQKPAYMLLTHDGISVVNHLDESSMSGHEQYAALQQMKKNTLQYKGLVPVILLREPKDVAKRNQDQISFEMTSGFPYVLFIERYAEIQSLKDTDPMIFGGFEYSGGCYSLRLTSSHGSKMVCVYDEDTKVLFK